MKFKVISLTVIIFSLCISTILWEIIDFSASNKVSKELFDNTNILKNPLNDPIKFLSFLLIPFICIICLTRYQNRFIFENFYQLIFFNKNLNSSYNLEKKKNELNFYTFLVFLTLFFEFLFLDFSKFNQNLDFFHEGMWLSASQNLKLTNEFWNSSFIVRGLFGDFYPYLLWEILNKETIGITRFFQLLIYFFNKIILVLIIRKLSIFTNFKKNNKILFFLLLTISCLSLQGYINPVFLVRSFLFLLFIYICLNFFQNYNKSFFELIIIGLFSSLSFFWYVDIGVYINFLIFLIIVMFMIKFEFRKFLITFISIFSGWFFFFMIFPDYELSQFYINTKVILNTLGWFHSLDFPNPILTLDGRALKSILFFLISGFLIIRLVNSISKENNLFIISATLLFCASLIYFNYALSRSDGGHIRVGSGLIQVTFFTLVLYFLINIFENFFMFKKKIINHFKKILLVSFIIITLFVNKQFENKSFLNLVKVNSSISTLINYKDEIFIDDNHREFINYYDNLTKKDNCVAIFTNEVAMYYFLKKTSCSKHYFMWATVPKKLQLEFMNDLQKKKPTFIIYKSDIDLFFNSDKVLTRTKQYIDENFKFYDKKFNWEIYKRI